MQVFLTNIETPIRCRNYHGTVDLHSLRVWPGWSFPTFNTIFSYERGAKKIVVPVIMGKTYTFKDLELLVNEHLNANEQVALLYHNNGRVIWRVFPDKPTNPKISAGMAKFLRPKNIELSAGIKDLLNLTTARTSDSTTTGQPVTKSSITFTFSDVKMIFLTCDQIDNTFLNDKSTKTLAIIPIANGVFSTTSSSSFSFCKNYDRKLKFRLQDKNGNSLPIKQMLAHLTIND